MNNTVVRDESPLEVIPWTLWDMIRRPTSSRLTFFGSGWGLFECNVHNGQLTSPLRFRMKKILVKFSDKDDQCLISFMVGQKIFYEKPLWLFEEKGKVRFDELPEAPTLIIPPGQPFCLEAQWKRSRAIKGPITAYLDGDLFRRIL